MRILLLLILWALALAPARATEELQPPFGFRWNDPMSRVEAVLKGAKAAAGHLVKIEIEVDSLEQLDEVLKVGLADVVLIDNFDVASMTKAVALVAGRLVIEASGGITLDNIAEIAATGVDYASSGALTHSAPALDVGLDIEV